MRTLIHKSLVLKQGDMILKEYDYKGKAKKIVFEIVNIAKVKKIRATGKFKVKGWGKLRKRVEIKKEHAKKGYDVSAMVWFSDNKRYAIFDDTDDYYPPNFPIRFNRHKFSKTRFYLLDESEALLYKGL